MESVLYSATATSWGGRQGRVLSADSRLDLNLSSPASMGGDDGPGTNPEQLFAAGYSACFHGALKGEARARKIDVSEAAVSVTVSLIRTEDGKSVHLAAKIEAELPGIDSATAHELIEASHQRCPYSLATRGNMPVELVIIED